MSRQPPLAERAVTVLDFPAAKKQGRKLVVVTAYDYPMARLCDRAEMNTVLMGNSLGMVVQGQPDCLGVTLEEILYHSRLVARGCRRALVVADLPFMSYQISSRQALHNAGRLLKEARVHAVKLEGGQRCRKVIRRLVETGIPVMGHVGLTPQSYRTLGGFRVQRDENRLLEDALAVEEAGAFAVVVECVPADSARRLTERLRIPTIGIGAGAGCDGQVLVGHDLLGLSDGFRPRFAKQYADLGGTILAALEQFRDEVRQGQFPAAEHEFQ